MAQAGKAPPKPAPAVKAKPEKVAKPSATPPKTVATPPKAAATTSAMSPTSLGLRLALGILVLALLTGVTPLALAGQALGYWRIPFTPPSLPFLFGGLTYDAPLAKPQPMLANATIHVTTTPGGGASVATLEPGFPVEVTRYATDNGARWAQIRWSGPTKAAGGSGWAQASQLRTPVTSGAKPIGDLAALSQTVAKGATAAGAGFAAWVYFPDGGYTYHSANATQTITLGKQIIPVVLVADYGLSLASQQPSSMVQNLVNGDPTALQFIFLSVDRNGQLDAFLARSHLTGFHITTDSTASAATILASTASIQDLGLFYTALTQNESPLASPDDQRQIFALLVGGNTNATAYASASEIGAGALVVTTEQTAKGYTTIVAGQLRPTNGPAVVVSAISADQSTAAKSQAALQAFFKSLLSTIA